MSKNNYLFIEWDVHNWSKSFKFWLKYSKKNLKECNVLELGGRNGGLSLWMSKRCKHVICSDLGGVTEEALSLKEKYNIDNISYEDINALDIPYENQFDIIMFKSVLGGVGYNNNYKNQQLMMEQIYKALKPNGEVWFIENCKSSPLHRFCRRHFVSWGKAWRYIKYKEVKQLSEKFNQVEFTSVGFLGAFGRAEWQRRLLGYCDTLLFDHIVPKPWRYILIGILKKGEA